MSHSLSVAILKQNVDALPQKDQYFANSLLYQFDTKGSLSSKQWYWVEKLADGLAQHSPTTGEPVQQAPVATSIAVGDFTGVITLFKQAKQHLKFPHIRLQLPNGQPISLSMAGLKSKAPGTINCTDGKPFGMNKWYGRVTPDGMFEKSHSVDGDTQTMLVALLTKLAKDPARVAASYGKLTGQCCFCTSTLTDKRSTQVGYGAICAAKWGQPYPKKAEKAQFVADSPTFTLDLKSPVPLVEQVEKQAEAKLTATINDADLGNEIMNDLLAKFSTDADALKLLRKMAKLAAAEKVAA